MSDCEICGRSGAGTEVMVEGSKLVVCRLCASLGQSLQREPAVRPSAIRKPTRLPDELKLELREDLAQLIRKGREKLGLTQEQLTLRLSMPNNTIRRVEGGWTPPMDILKRLETVTRVSLMEGTGSTTELRKKLEKKMLTVGDIVDLK